MKPKSEIFSWLAQISAPEVCQLATAQPTKKRPRSSESPGPIAGPFLSPTSISLLLSSSHQHCQMLENTNASTARLPETPLRPSKRLKRAGAPAVGAAAAAAPSIHRGGDGSDYVAEEGADDQDATPRQMSMPIITASSSQSLHSNASSSRRSGRSSPLKRLRSLALRDDGIQTRPLSRGDSRLPPALVELLDEMADIGEGIRVIPAACRAGIEEAAAAAQAAGWASFRLPRATHYASEQTTGDAREILKPRPSVQQVLSIVEWATICQQRNAEEAAWNSAVHFPILRLALHGGDRPTQGSLIDITQCTSATIISEYLSTGTSGKKVDFVLHIDPTNAGDGDDAAARIDSRRAVLPLLSINHTDHDALVKEPVAVSIKTKRFAADRSASEAQVQMGTWQAAQWNLLANLTAMISGSAGGDESVDGLQYLPYLPAIIVQGHDWAFAATTREAKKTILWSECPFGSTRDLVGVYKIICGVQRLATFARETYWPWYRTYILGLPS